MERLNLSVYWLVRLVNQSAHLSVTLRMELLIFITQYDYAMAFENLFENALDWPFVQTKPMV